MKIGYPAKPLPLPHLKRLGDQQLTIPLSKVQPCEQWLSKAGRRPPVLVYRTSTDPRRHAVRMDQGMAVIARCQMSVSQDGLDRWRCQRLDPRLRLASSFTSAMARGEDGEIAV